MKRHLIILSLTLALWACSSSRITSTWQADTVPGKTYDKIMVIGLIGDPDRSIRERMEEHLAGDLKDLGYNAVTAIHEYGPKAFDNLSEDEALKLLSTKSIDAVITVVLLDKTKEAFYVRGSPRYFSARSHSFDPMSSSQLGHEYGLMIVKDMEKKKILHPVTEPPKKAF